MHWIFVLRLYLLKDNYFDPLPRLRPSLQNVNILREFTLKTLMDIFLVIGFIVGQKNLFQGAEDSSEVTSP